MTLNSFLNEWSRLVFISSEWAAWWRPGPRPDSHNTGHHNLITAPCRSRAAFYRHNLITNHWITSPAVRMIQDHLWENIMREEVTHSWWWSVTCCDGGLWMLWWLITDCHNRGVTVTLTLHRWHNCHTTQIIAAHSWELQKPDTVCTVSSDRMMPQKLIFDGPGSLAMKVQSGLITIKLISISKLPKAIKPDTQERGLRESVQKWGEINL